MATVVPPPESTADTAYVQVVPVDEQFTGVTVVVVGEANGFAATPFIVIGVNVDVCAAEMRMPTNTTRQALTAVDDVLLIWSLLFLIGNDKMVFSTRMPRGQLALVNTDRNKK